MALTELDGGVVTGVREARRVLTSSSRTSADDGGQGSMEMLVQGPVFCHKQVREQRTEGRWYERI